MYQYTDFDRQFVQARASQYRDQLTRWQAWALPEHEFRPLRLQNVGMCSATLCCDVAVPYGELNTAQLRVLAKIRTFGGRDGFRQASYWASRSKPI
jgi:sulfite reductase (NADPH) hemoprotein beta-component